MALSDVSDTGSLLKYAFNAGIGAVFGLATLYILYLVAISGQQANSDDLKTIKSNEQTIMEQHLSISSGLETLTRVQRATCLNVAKNAEAASRCNP